jgi:putative cell wall-binding protein
MAARLLRILCAFILLASMLVVSAPRVALAADPDLVISTPAEFKEFANRVTNDHETFVGQTVVLANDIDLATSPLTEKWVPIGSINYWFQGTFDGQYHRIDNMVIDDTTVPTASHAGLFYYGGSTTTVQATFQNFYLSGSIELYTGAHAAVGSVTAQGGRILRVGSSVDITIAGTATTGYLGGISGGYAATGGTTVIQCYNEGNISYNRASAFIGGVLGNGRGGSVVESYNLGSVTSTLSGYVAGITGGGNQGAPTVHNSYNAGTVSNNGGASGVAIAGSYTNSGTYPLTVTSIHNNYWLDSSATVGAGSAVQDVLYNALAVTDAQLQGTDPITHPLVAYTNTNIVDLLNVQSANANSTGNAFKPGNTYPLLWWEKVVAGAPLITSQPVETWTQQGTAATPLSVSATTPDGTKLAATGGKITRVQWFSNTQASYTAGTPTSFKDTVYNLDEVTDTCAPSVTTLGDTYYWAELTNTWTDGTVQTEVIQSNIVRVRVTDSAQDAEVPVFTDSTQPANVSWYQHSTDGVLSAEATGKGTAEGYGVLTYQWYVSDADGTPADGTTGAVIIAGAKSSTYSPPTPTIGTMYYFCVATNTTNGVMVSAPAVSRRAAVNVHGIEIRNPENLLALQATVDSTNPDVRKDYSGYAIELLDDIDLSASELTEEWVPIGIDATRPFLGEFRGYGHTISGLSITGYEGPYAGLFGYVGAGASVRDLVVKGTIDVGDGVYGSAGGVAGYIIGTTAANAPVIQNVGSEVDVTSVTLANVSVGGVAGSVRVGRILSSYHKGTVSGGYQVGGIAGLVVNTLSIPIDSNYSQGVVILTATSASAGITVGGIAGYSANGITNSYSTTTVTAAEGLSLGAVGGFSGTGSTNVHYLMGVTGEVDTDKVGAVAETDVAMRDSAFVATLNGSGSAFVAVSGDYPRLAWEGQVATSVDRAPLTEALSLAEKTKAGVRVSEDGTDIDPALSWVTQRALDDLDAAVFKASLTLGDPSPTQAQIDAAVSRLNLAIEVFKALKAQGTMIIEEDPKPPVDEQWKRLSGDDRYDTMKDIVIGSGAFTREDTDTVIIATGTNFPDALAATGLGGILEAPVVLTAPNSLSPQAKDVIVELKPSTIYIVGGTSVVSPSVESELATLVSDPSKVIRASGPSRTATTLDIYTKGGGTWGTTAIIACGTSFADALSISPYAYAERAPVFLADSKTGLDAATTIALKAILRLGRIDHIIIVGGTAVVPDAVKVQLGYQATDTSTFTRLGGIDRYATSVTIAAWIDSASPSLGFNKVAVATGANFPDALAGGAFCGKVGTVLLLADDTPAGRTDIATVISAHSTEIGFGHVLGGDSVISALLKAELEAASATA